MKIDHSNIFGLQPNEIKTLPIFYLKLYKYLASGTKKTTKLTQ